MKNAFFIVGPTASGKSELGAAVGLRCDAEIVSADAFQIYRSIDILSAQPDHATLAKVPHHLVGNVSLLEQMNAEKFRRMALEAIHEIEAGGKLALIVGGSGLYVKALTHGLSPLPPQDPRLRAELESLSAEELAQKLEQLDAERAKSIDLKNPRRLVRAIEIAVGIVADRGPRSANVATDARGVFVFRDREELYARINQRVEKMFEQGVVEEVKNLGDIGPTASQTIGLREIQELIAGRMSMLECVSAIQQATRHYAKRQLTWFRGQTSFDTLNLSHTGYDEAVEWISQRARRSLAHAE